MQNLTFYLSSYLRLLPPFPSKNLWMSRILCWFGGIWAHLLPQWPDFCLKELTNICLWNTGFWVEGNWTWVQKQMLSFWILIILKCSTMFSETTILKYQEVNYFLIAILLPSDNGFVKIETHTKKGWIRASGQSSSWLSSKGSINWIHKDCGTCI